MLKARIDRKVTVKAKVPDPNKDREHLGFVRSLPCIVCGRPPRSQAHHMLRSLDGSPPKGAGLKHADRWTVPLCNPCHKTVHRDGNDDRWFAERGMDLRAKCEALYRVSGDQEAGERIVWRARHG